MNKMVDMDFAEPVENPALKKLVKAWESKQARVAKQASGFGLMAVSLAACGSSSSDSSDSSGGGTEPVETGNIFNLTTGVDTMLSLLPEGDSGILGNIFQAGLGLGIDGLVGVQTLQSADVLVGTDEVDQLHAVLNGTGAGGPYAAPSITNIEEFYLTAEGGIFPNAGLDLSNSTGYTQIWNDGSNHSLDVIGVGELAVIGLDDVRGGTVYNVEYTSSADTSVQDVIAKAVGTSEVTGQAGLNITAPNDIGTLNLDVSDIVRLDMLGDAAGMSVFNITGSGVTELSGDGRFVNLETLDSTGYEGDLTLDVSGSEDLASVQTGDGSDFITVNTAAVNGDLSVDLGVGADTLSLDNNDPAWIDEGNINGLNFAGGVAGVETLAFANHVDLNGDAILDMEGISSDLEILEFTESIGGGFNELTLANSPIDDLSINAPFINELALNTGNVVNLEVNTSEWMDIVGLAGDDLETLILNQVGDGSAWLTANSNVNELNSLKSIDVNASNDGDDDNVAFAVVNITDANGSLENGLISLETVTVVADDSAWLDMTGTVSSIDAAQATLDDAVTAVDNAQDDVADADQAVSDAEQDVLAAEAGIPAAQADVDAELVIRDSLQNTVGMKQQIRDDALADKTLADTAVTDAQADKSAADQAVLDAQADKSAADQAVLDAQADVDNLNGIKDYVEEGEEGGSAGVFEAGAGDNANINNVSNYIIAAGFDADVTNALLAVVPNVGDTFDSAVEWAAFVTAANAAVDLELDEPTLTQTLNDAVADQTAAQTALSTAVTDQSTAQTALNTAVADQTAAQTALDIAQNDVDDAEQDVTNHENGALATAQQALADAQQVVDDAEALVVTREGELTTAQDNLADAEADVVTAQQALADAIAEGVGFEALQDVVVDAGDNAFVTLENVYGNFTLNVTAEGTEGVSDDTSVDVELTANVNLTNTGATEVTIEGGDEFVYTYDTSGTEPVADGLDYIDLTVVNVGGAEFGNEALTSLTIEGAAANVTLSDDLSGFEILDLTGVSNVFIVDASNAEFDPGSNEFVTYLIGGTASELGGNTFDGGDSQINMDTADARESVIFTDGDFGTVVLNNFTAGPDASVSDRIDLSQLGFTGANGQVKLEVGDYDAGTGEWTTGTTGGTGDDVRITDLAGGVTDFSGEIIVTGDSVGGGQDLSDDLSGYNLA